MNRFQPLLILLFTAFCIVGFGFEWLLTPGASFGADNSAHLAVSVHVAEVVKAGGSDFWWHHSNFGVPLFAAYQPLPSLFLGFLLAVFSDLCSPYVIFKATILVTWALMPFAWYVGGRWFGLRKSLCLFLGLLTLSIQDPYNIGFSPQSSTVRGLYTQHFAMLFYPLFIGSFRRLVEAPTGRVLSSSCLLALTVMSHLWVGLYAGITALAVLCFFSAQSTINVRYLLKWVLVSTILLGWWLVPLLLTNSYAGGLPWMYETHNGWAWRKSLSMLLTGGVFDHQRPPILTFLAVSGGIGALFHLRSKKVRILVALSAVTFILFLGRTNLGSFYGWLPMHDQINVMRYLTGVHICGILYAAGFLSWSYRKLKEKYTRIAFVFPSLFGGILSLYTGYEFSQHLQNFDADSTDFKELVQYLSQRPDHRFAVHNSLGTGSHFHRDLLPMLSDRGQIQSYAHGFHCTLSTYYAEYFDFSPTNSALFDVNSIVAKYPLPDDFPADAYNKSWSNEAYVVLHPEEFGKDTGLFEFVAIDGEIEAPSFREMRPVVKALGVVSYAESVLPRLKVDPNGSDLFVTTSTGRRTRWSDWDASLILSQPPFESSIDYHDGLVSLVDFSRGLSDYSITTSNNHPDPRWLLLKVNYFPWWHAYIDGEEITIEHVAPNFMAVLVPSGVHFVRFEYQNPVYQKVSFLLSLFLFLTWPTATYLRSCVNVTNREALIF